MPRAFMFTKEEIISAAVELTREKGFSALTARALGERLGSSSKPIFGLFESMAEIKSEVLNAANNIYLGYLKRGAESGEYPPYKASGMAYIRSPFLKSWVGVPLRMTPMSVCGLAIASVALPFMAGLTWGMPSPFMP